jgi:hypothetical protein
MSRLHNKIQYRFEETAQRATIRISSKDKAIHQFLKFLITDHKTSDPVHSSRSGPQKKDSSWRALTGKCQKNVKCAAGTKMAAEMLILVIKSIDQVR